LSRVCTDVSPDGHVSLRLFGLKDRKYKQWKRNYSVFFNYWSCEKGPHFGDLYLWTFILCVHVH